MKNAIKSLTSSRKHGASASVVDGKLILSLPHAITPVVWQMDLDHAKASALEVREGQQAGIFTLTLKTPRGEAVDIAPFQTRDQAIDGLMAAANALKNAQGQIRPVNTNINHASSQTNMAGQQPRPRHQWLSALLGVLLLFTLLGVWSAMTPPAPMGTDPGDAPPATNLQQTEPGVPLSADEFLKGR